jgi:hypothetical protein
MSSDGGLGENAAFPRFDRLNIGGHQYTTAKHDSRRLLGLMNPIPNGEQRQMDTPCV